MGLSAVVYKNSASLPEHLRTQVRIIDPSTAELELLNPELAHNVPEKDLVAFEVFLGNVAMIGWLADQIQNRWGERCATLLRTFLYNGTHCGDTVSLTQIARIKLELKQLEADGEALPEDLRRFFISARQLIPAAETEGNPIVFV